MAAPASSFVFYTTLFNHLNTVLTTYIGDTATHIITAITPVATTMLTIYVILWGWSMMRGVISEPITDGIFRILKLTTIIAIALNLGRYNTFLGDWLWQTPDALASAIGGGHSALSTSNYLDNVMNKMYDFGDSFVTQAFVESTWGIPNLALLAAGWVLWGVGLVATAYGAFLLALAKISLAVVLGLGPLFVLLVMFEPTKRFFDAWIGQAINAVFLIVLTAATLYLVMDVLMGYLALAQPGAYAKPSTEMAIPAIAFAVIGGLVLVQIPAIASALGGGVATGTLGAATWAYGKTKAGMANMRPTNLRRSARKAAHDIALARGAVNAPGAALANKIRSSRSNRVSQG